MRSDRERMEYDVVIVGAGHGLAAINKTIINNSNKEYLYVL